jgi:hypothetical protein
MECDKGGAARSEVSGLFCARHMLLHGLSLYFITFNTINQERTEERIKTCMTCEV